MRLTLGPVLYNWPADDWSDFYARIADEAPVDRVVVGEVVCSKRLPFYQNRIPEVVERLQRGGKEVVLASLGLVTLRRERRMLAELVESGLPVEVNDLTALRHLAPGTPFTVGPLVNVYNRGTLGFLARRGGISFCLPPELAFSSVATLAATGAGFGVDIEVWAFGRLPLALSARCYHARLAGLAKDSCQFVCEQDPDGLPVETLDGQPFLAINGVQTVSERWANLAGDLAPLAEAGVGALRLSPHTGDMVEVARLFRAAADDRIAPDEALAELAALAPERRFANGFLFGQSGAEWTH
ncbi:U32 family peptidase [Aurantimonas sp. C2-6-R+9]|uniref:ubiquinone anaerobic biosynthesis protein UbiV n=1 Tax=unclassified Aurantimonas TaxID=2638230 RepID=UPI002E18B5C3|nr:MULTISPECIES: U32 family peptidase [unclassified Aurantimonas]MEC5290259.1 U32 family peptidase [Aurantimonas sp. C2-3-R2]MEC5321678.1 U32 family peptidase [Aurantimonas sp. A3-2-R12]MEC5380370.1 U32 family peptidase [Aurantimonas sp. C2-6-R+9]MEC5411323.1 U32 family peptidase [Aurantimonas sp. C2-4-R8]